MGKKRYHDLNVLCSRDIYWSKRANQLANGVNDQLLIDESRL